MLQRSVFSQVEISGWTRYNISVARLMVQVSPKAASRIKTGPTEDHSDPQFTHTSGFLKCEYLTDRHGERRTRRAHTRNPTGLVWHPHRRPLTRRVRRRRSHRRHQCTLRVRRPICGGTQRHCQEHGHRAILSLWSAFCHRCECAQGARLSTGARLGRFRGCADGLGAGGKQKCTEIVSLGAIPRSLYPPGLADTQTIPTNAQHMCLLGTCFSGGVRQLSVVGLLNTTPDTALAQATSCADSSSSPCVNSSRVYMLLRRTR